MATSDFRLEVEIWLYRACAMKNMQYNRYYRSSSVTWTWLWDGADTTFHRTYFWFKIRSRLDVKNFCFVKDN